MLLAATALWLAAISSFFGLLWNQDVVLMIHFGLSVWALSTVAIERARLWTWVSSLSLFGITALAMVSCYHGYCYGLYNLFWRWDDAVWINPAFVIANYIAVTALLVRSRLLLRAGERRLVRVGLTAAGVTAHFSLVVWAWLSILMVSPETSYISNRSAVLGMHVYERWVIDYGGTGGYGCGVYEIRTIGLIARYKPIDRSTAPIDGGC